MATSIFEIVGPVMIGPSSSHTAGMARIGMMAHRILNMEPEEIHLDLSPKLRATYSGHRSDAALLGGAYGYSQTSDELKNAADILHEKGIRTSVGFLPEGQYPENTARVTMVSGNESHSITGESVGGGSIVITEIDRVPVRLNADEYHIITWGKSLCCHSSVKPFDSEEIDVITKSPGISKCSYVQPVLEYGGTIPGCEKVASCEEVINTCRETGITIADAAIRYEMSRSGRSRECIVALMKEQLKVIRESVKKGQMKNDLLYGLASGKDSGLLMKYIKNTGSISGGIIPNAISYAIGVMEYNASMGCVVAAPTAGSSGIVPGALTAAQEEYDVGDDAVINALFTSALIGVIMSEKGVSFSGSVGGCQGEIGVSSAITAAGLASMFTDDPEIIMNAMALCLKNLLGLVCDPIAGPVEIPCIKRNAVGVANAFISADMALAGITSFIPPDEVIDALIDVEKRLPDELKAATIGGLACTKTAACVRRRLGQ